MRDDGVVVGRGLTGDAPRTYNEVMENLEVLRTVTGGKAVPGLWDPGAVPKYEPDALRALIAGLEKSLTALAIVLPSVDGPALGAFPDAINAFLLPVRVFGDEAEALEWLREFAAD